MRKKHLIISVLLLVSLTTSCSSFKHGLSGSMISAGRSMSGLKHGLVQIPGQTMAYLERPGSGETIVLIHGFSANKDNWIFFTRYIPADYRVIAFDMPGHGDNAKAFDKTYSIDYLTESFGQAVDALKLGRFHIAGNSMGGYIAILYAARNPQRVITMCLLDNAGLHSYSQHPSDLQIALVRGQSPLTPASEEDFSELMKYAFYKEPFIPWPITSVQAEKAVESSAFIKKMWTDLNTHDVDLLPLLSTLKLPVLVIWGDRDRILHVSTTEILKRSLPDGEIIIMKDCGHMPMLERPEETARYYLSFLNKHANNQYIIPKR
ncbi:MAG: alpha/beta fold hydrolase [Syntrophales bacterium LBB04]|nr:alpha/beta fold hydrolase [Syntrophales bacterium LBB04]